jgi:hypothetical protein
MSRGTLLAMVLFPATVIIATSVAVVATGLWIVQQQYDEGF